MINRRDFGAVFASAAACMLAAAVSGCEGTDSAPPPEVEQDQQEARNKSMEYMQGKSKSKKKK